MEDRDRETERQRDRETERQRARETERQRDSHKWENICSQLTLAFRLQRKDIKENQF